MSPALPTKFPTPPVAEKKAVRDTRHGIERVDEYSWLRADNWQEVFRDPGLLPADIRAYLEAENTYQDEMMAGTKALQATLFEEMKGRIKEDDSSVPMPDGPFEYGVSYVVGGEHPQFIRIPRGGKDEQIILDGNAEAGDCAYFKLGGVDHDPGHKKLIWGYDDKGSEYYTLKVRVIGRDDDEPDVVENTGGGGVWDHDSAGFYYAALDENHRPSAVYYHRLGEDQSQDQLIYEEADAGFFVGVEASHDHQWILISIHDHETSEVRIISAQDPTRQPRLVQARATGVQYDLEAGGDEWFILTNCDGAKDFKIMTAPIDKFGQDKWSDLVPHQAGTLILSCQAFTHHIIRLERKDGLAQIVVRERDTGHEHIISFDEEAYSLGLIGAAEYDTRTIRFSYSSMTTPGQVYDYNMDNRSRLLRKTQEVPSGHNAQDYITRRVMVTAEDGAEIPVSLLMHKSTKLDGTAPCLLYGYGAYGISIPASFNTSCLSLVDRGFVYAIAHIRGGKDKGYAWYEDGKRNKKTNSFKDFIAVSRYMAAEKISSSDRIVAQGGSAGGMLMGAVANMAPDAFGAIVAEVPFVDVLNTMLDDTLPLTPPEWPEWGNPILSKEDFEFIASYSPYDNVRAQNYPPILALAGLTDPRVTYWEPAKWVARLRDRKIDDNIILFRTNMDAGHAGASGRFERLKEVAFVYAFALTFMSRSIEV